MSFTVKSDGSLLFSPQGKTRPQVLSPLSRATHCEATDIDTEVCDSSQGLLKNDAEIEALSKMSNQALLENATDPSLCRVHIPPAELGLRQSAVVLMKSLDLRMKALNATSQQLSRFEFGQRTQQIFNDVVYELIRQVAVQSGERAKLLATIWVRSSDIMNSLTRLFVAEHARHEQEEFKLREELKKSRKDYLLVVERLENLIREQHDSQAQLLAEADSRENVLCHQIDQLKNELYQTTSRLRNLIEDGRRAALPPVRPPPELHDGQSLELEDVVASEDPRVTISNLKAELQRQRVLMLEAAGEATRLKDCAPGNTNMGVTAFPEMRDAALDPVEELLSSSSEEDDESSAKHLEGARSYRKRDSQIRQRKKGGR